MIGAHEASVSTHFSYSSQLWELMHEPPAQFEDLNGCSQYCMITYKPFIRLMGYALLYYTVQVVSPSVAAAD